MMLSSTNQVRTMPSLPNQVDTDISHSNSDDTDSNMARLTPEDLLEKFVEQM